MIKKSFTLAEVLISVVIVGIIATCMVVSVKKSDYLTESYKKAGASTLLQINYSTKQILAKYSYSYQMTGLKTLAGAKFSITASGADANLAELYKKVLGTKSYSAPSTYTGADLVNEAGSKVGSYKVSSFAQGFQIKNGTYFAIKLNGNCTTSESYIYDPSARDIRTASNSCGLIFFDVSAHDGPNIVGVDQYIVSIGKMGIK